MITIKTASGKVLGRFRSELSGKTFCETLDGKCKGYYDKNMDRTYTMDGRVISTGNSLAALLI